MKEQEESSVGVGLGMARSGVELRVRHGQRWEECARALPPKVGLRQVAELFGDCGRVEKLICRAHAGNEGGIRASL